MSRTKLLLTACCAVALTASHVVAQPKVDAGKKKIESGTRTQIAETAPAPRPVVAAIDNPTVEPGKVKWHKSFEAARTAAAYSGKPVLLFQMMGRLDQQFT